VNAAGYSGVVYIHPEWELVPRELAIEGHWELEGLDRPAEEGPGWRTAAEAIEWGRKRAPTVYLRVHLAAYSYRYVRAGEILVRLQAPVDDRFVIYSAGETHPTPRQVEGEEDVEPEDVRRWPGGSDERDPDVLPRYGGWVYLVQSRPEMEAGAFLGYTARWEALRKGRLGLAEVRGPDWEGDLPAAVAWGRERAPYVLVCDGPVGFGYESAGEHELPGLELPRWLGPSDVSVLEGDLPQLPPGSWRIAVSEPRSRRFPIPDQIEPEGGLPAATDDRTGR
jgi:hypothetical protein